MTTTRRTPLRPKPRATRKKPARKDKPELPVIDTEPYTPGRLVPLGVYGFKKQELAILTALVTGDPMLLIGRSGTGKTYLLNSLSEALGLEHRHYNASTRTGCSRWFTSGACRASPWKGCATAGRR